ncbi:Cytochrome P450 CYP4c [Frankliniella occidentalis]|uniref:Cytochrome P450 4c3 n=1 Tax=Frankliniella occidentalis TaxID=133901 RepID=A0A6J1SZ98_FRAOC|nr:cytochrome P450 4c3 [Frankliniella occidentalis]KAE8746742.1 Cytochrome P450 CYP4c [Frankliniella occidentalis]
MSPLTAVALAVLVALLTARWWRRRRLVALIERIPGPFALPILGNTLEQTVEHDELFGRLNGITQLFGRQHGICRTWFCSQPYVVLSSPAAVEAVLGSNRLTDKSDEYLYLRPWLGTGLLTSSGAKWHRRRKVLTPAFHFRILDDFIDVFREQAAVLADKMEALAGDPEGFNVFPLVTLCTLDIICETAMGRKVNAQVDSESPYVRAVYDMAEIVLTRQSTVWYQPDWLFHLTPMYRRQQRCLADLHGFSTKVIRERKAEILDEARLKGRPGRGGEDDLGSKRRLAFLDLLIEASQGGAVLSDDDIREEVDTFMFEGHDTTSAAISWCLFLIGCDPHVQRQVHAELDDIFADDPGRGVTMKDLAEMKYLECCIKEALRLYPSVPAFARSLREDTQIGPYTVPAGTTAMLVIYMLHRNAEVFPEPEVFDPDRFLPDNCVGRHPFAYVPFSAGPRNCIGQKFALLEEKSVLSALFRRLRFESLDRREDLTLHGELIIRPKDGLRVRAHRRA